MRLLLRLDVGQLALLVVPLRIGLRLVLTLVIDHLHQGGLGCVQGAALLLLALHDGWGVDSVLLVVLWAFAD